jgi:isoamylase
MTHTATHSAFGAHIRGDGVDFAIFSGAADTLEVALEDEGRESRHALKRDDHDVWRVHIAGAGHGTHYGFRAHGAGRCDPAKLLLDPYAREIAGAVTWDPAVTAPDADSAPFAPRSVVHDAPFDWGDDAPPGTALADSVIYELHVKGFTKLQPDVPQAQRGTFGGVAHRRRSRTCSGSV